jgi:hypothetical protein
LENVKKTFRINKSVRNSKERTEGLKIPKLHYTRYFLVHQELENSVARLLSRIFKHLGFLSKGQLIETDREGMIAGFVGQTVLKLIKL